MGRVKTPSTRNKTDASNSTSERQRRSTTRRSARRGISVTRQKSSEPSESSYRLRLRSAVSPTIVHERSVAEKDVIITGEARCLPRTLTDCVRVERLCSSCYCVLYDLEHGQKQRVVGRRSDPQPTCLFHQFCDEVLAQQELAEARRHGDDDGVIVLERESAARLGIYGAAADGAKVYALRDCATGSLGAPALRRPYFVEVSGKSAFRALSSRVDYGWIQKKLQACESQHLGHCTDRVELDLPSLRMIDCLKNRVVHWIQDMEAGGYLALSYVWGRRKSEGHQDAFADGIVRNPPPTISDAIKVTLGLGYRYLWVDRYCIPGAGADRHLQLQNMGHIYRNADLTIIAAAGEDPWHGLPGVDKTLRTRQTSVTLGRRTFSTLPKPIAWELDRSSWNSRAWTFQESLLSRRHLVFTDAQVFFQCREMRCFETLSRPTVGAVSNTVPRMLSYDDYPDFHQLVRTYMQRNLSFPGDVLNAFKGILQAYASRKRPIGNYYGVPLYGKVCDGMRDTDVLVYGLLWSHDVVGARTDPFVHRHVARHPRFPSWSWTGWRLNPRKASYDFHPWPLSELLLNRGLSSRRKSFQVPLEVSVGFHDGSTLPWEEHRDEIVMRYLSDNNNNNNNNNHARYLELQGWVLELEIPRQRTYSGPKTGLTTCGPFKVRKQDLLTACCLLGSHRTDSFVSQCGLAGRESWSEQCGSVLVDLSEEQQKEEDAVDLVEDSEGDEEVDGDGDNMISLTCVVMCHLGIRSRETASFNRWLYCMAVKRRRSSGEEEEEEDVYDRVGLLQLDFDNASGQDIWDEVERCPGPLLMPRCRRQVVRLGTDQQAGWHG